MEGNTLDQSEQFFVTGLEKYMDAKSAVEMFEEVVQRRVKEVVLGAEHRSDIVGFFGEDWKDYSYEMPDRAWIGQKAVFKDLGGLYFALYFARDKVKRDKIYLSPTAAFWRQRTTLLEPLWEKVKAIQPQPPGLSVSNWTFSLTGDQPSNAWASCKEALDTVIFDWTELWQKLDFLPRGTAIPGPLA